MGANIFLATKDSQTIDEAAHITAGYSYITTRDFRLNSEHPPLLKELSALPLLGVDVKDAKSLKAWASGDEWKAGKEFVYTSPSSPKTVLILSRMAPILLAYLLGLLVFILASFFTNRSFGLFAFGLFCLDPNITAHSHLVTTDVAAALGCLLVLASLFCYVWRPSFGRLILTGLSLGVALSFKHSLLIMLIFVPLLVGFSIFKYQNPGKTVSYQFWQLIKSCAFVVLLAAFTMFVFYGFEVVKPVSAAAYSGDLAKNNAIFSRFSDFYVPFYSYLRGLGQVIVHSQAQEGGRDAYLLGNYSADGFRNYFFVAMLIKTPLAILAGIFASLAIGIKVLATKIKNKLVLDKKTVFYLSLVAFIVIYLFFSLFNEINIGWRHVLPIYPVIYILMAAAAYKLAGQAKNPRLVYASVFALLIFTGISACTQFPKYISYSNEILPVINTSTNWPRLTDSNLDWGQDLYRLVAYAQANPNKQYSYQLFTNADFGRLNSLPNLNPNDKNFDTSTCKTTTSGYLVVSYQIVYNDYADTTYNCLRGKKPYYTIGSSLLIF